MGYGIKVTWLGHNGLWHIGYLGNAIVDYSDQYKSLNLRQSDYMTAVYMQFCKHNHVLLRIIMHGPFQILGATAPDPVPR